MKLKVACGLDPHSCCPVFSMMDRSLWNCRSNFPCHLIFVKSILSQQQENQYTIQLQQIPSHTKRLVIAAELNRQTNAEPLTLLIPTLHLIMSTSALLCGPASSLGGFLPQGKATRAFHPHVHRLGFCMYASPL